MCNMFAFHKPKIYRSNQGCCICRAKSSSSRFTDSKKYEVDFMQCFKLDQKRSGEICNACVLLIKRWKKLPKGTERNWNHVVDARAGPGNKAMLKNRMKSKVQATDDNGSSPSRKQKHGRPPVRIRKMRLMDTLTMDTEGNGVGYLTRNGHSPPSPIPSDYSDDMNGHDGSRLAEGTIDSEHDFPPSVRDFLDINCWRMEKVCCGTIFKGPRGEVLVDPHLLKPCRCAIYSSTVSRGTSDQIVPDSEHAVHEDDWNKNNV